MPDGVSLIWLDISVELLSTEEPYKEKLYVRICGEGGRQLLPLPGTQIPRGRFAIYPLGLVNFTFAAQKKVIPMTELQ